MRLELIDPPNAEVISASEVKDRLGIGTEISDAVIEAYIAAATAQLDGEDGILGRALITQLWEGKLDEFPSGDPKIEIPLPPLQEIISVVYVGSDGDVTLVVDVDYEVKRGARPYISPVVSGAWPTSSGEVTITFLAGYGDDGDDVPEAIRQAIVLMVSDIRSMSATNLFLSEDTVEGIGTKKYIVSGAAGQALKLAASSLLSGYIKHFI